MVDKRDRFEVIENPLEILRRQFEAASINFYHVDDVPSGARTIYFWVAPEELLYDHGDKNLRQQLDDSRGRAGWAATPSTNKQGEVIDGLVDVVETVDPDKAERMPSGRQVEAERDRRQRQELARPALRVIRNDEHP